MTHALTPRKDEAVARDRYVRALRSALCRAAEDVFWAVDKDSLDLYAGVLGTVLCIFESAEGPESEYADTVDAAIGLLYRDPQASALGILKGIFGLDPTSQVRKPSDLTEQIRARLKDLD